MSIESSAVNTPFSNEHSDFGVITHLRYGGHQVSPYVRARQSAGYHPPQDHYEALVYRLVGPATSWLDVGCGRTPFPGNDGLSKLLSQRCRKFVGVDPDEGIAHNPFLHDRHQTVLDRVDLETTFDLVTARMVVEHVSAPAEFVGALNRLTHPGSLVVIFTVNWWSVTTLAAHFMPMAVHHAAKRLLWKTEERDTFATSYLMNDRKRLTRLMAGVGFREREYRLLADAGLFWRVPYLRYGELSLWKLLRRLGATHWDTCILAIYERQRDGVE